MAKGKERPKMACKAAKGSIRRGRWAVGQRETTKVVPSTSYLLPEARCEYGDKIERTAEFVAGQAASKCSASFACRDPRGRQRGGVLNVMCESGRDVKKFREAFGEELNLLRRHRLAGRKAKGGR